jgi:signal transduction histidine kinase
MMFLGIAVILYTIRSITTMLLELKKAAQKIAQGATNIHLRNISNDVIGSLSESILRIDMANRDLANAAEDIGKGKFDVPINPRSQADVLGNAIIQMKNNLQRFTNEMIELEKRKDTFITMASHELKTPITSIKGYVQLLLKMVIDIDKKGEEFSRPLLHSSLLTIDKQVTKLTRLISELLDLSKIETGQFEMRIQQFSVNDLVAETVKDLQQITTHHRISLQNGLERKIQGDRDRIGQVLTNLLTNAIKYSPRSDKIELQVYPVGDKEIAISVRDYGIGIENSHQERIFERFYRVEGEKEKTYPGFGIGLFIASEIIHRHNGKIKVESEPGKGSVFTVILPVNN